jgi:putative intracellular protease/amidase
MVYEVEKMNKNVLMIASNYGLWAEELQAPWDALNKAGFDLTLATFKGLTPLPLKLSLDQDFIDPLQNYQVNPPEVANRVNEILDKGEWDHCIKVTDARMKDFDSIAIIGGPGSALDITGNLNVHSLLLDAFLHNKVIAAICYAVAALAFTRNPEAGNKSIIYGKRVTAHPHAWDFNTDMSYGLVRTTPENSGTDLISPGFVYPLQYMVEDAVGPAGEVLADEKASRDKPCVVWDKPFATALSVESSIAFGNLLVEVLSD